MNLEALISRFRAPLIGYVAGQGASWAEAGEIAQDVFVSAYLGAEAFRGSFEDTLAVGRWLRGIARNKLREQLRARQRQQRRDPTELDQLPAATGQADSAAETALRTAVDALPSKLRSVVYMHHLDEVALSDVAALLGISVRAVEGRLYRARARLRAQLQPPATDSLQPTTPARGPRP